MLRGELPMTTIRFYTAPLSMFGAKAEIALLEKGLAFERIAVAFDSQDRYEPKHPEVLRVNRSNGAGADSRRRGALRLQPDLRISRGCFPHHLSGPKRPPDGPRHASSS
jgi:hypothetical protein